MYWLKAKLRNVAKSETKVEIKYVWFGDRTTMLAIVDEWHWRREGIYDINEDDVARIGS